MIASFRSKGLQLFFETGNGRKLSVQSLGRIGRILRALDVAVRAEDLDLPGYRFHQLSGREKGRFAVDASGNWRVTFAWRGEDATDVDLEDYH
jgi:toxin HigB-1